MSSIYEQTWKFIGIPEYIVWKLCEEYWINFSFASRTSLFNLKEGVWDSDILGALGLDLKPMPNVVPSGTAVWEVSTEASLETGLARGTEIVVEAHDSHCSTLGACVVEEAFGWTRRGVLSILWLLRLLIRLRGFHAVKSIRQRIFPL